MQPSKNKITSLKEYLIGTPDRAYSFISVIISLLSIIITIFLWKFPEEIPPLIIIRDIIVICLLLLVSGLLLFKYIRRESYLNNLNDRLKTSNNRLNKQFSNFHSIVHKFRNDIFKHYINKIPDEIIVSNAEKGTFEKICHSVTIELKKVMIDYLESRDIHLKDDLCVTVKLTLKSNNIIELYGATFDKKLKQTLRRNNKMWVITVYRDPETYEKHREKRDVGSRIYSVEKNTAFKNIFYDKEQVFANDNLQMLGDHYKNENTSWKKQYNSTIVAPIRYFAPEKSAYKCFGFIAIDSMNTCNEKIFENEESKYIIGHAADLIAIFFLMLSLSKSTDQQILNLTA